MLDSHDPVSEFGVAFRRWTEGYCTEKKHAPPDNEWFDQIERSIPHGLMENIVVGLHNGTIRELGSHQFVPEGAYEPRHYSWFAGFGARGPKVWWEAFVHAAEFSRVKTLSARNPELRVGFEDEKMDITLYRGETLLACYEVKRTGNAAELLISKLRKWGETGVSYDMPDRRNDTLRKAKYLAFSRRNRPKYFSVVAIGTRREFSVSYNASGSNVRFELHDDVIPIG